MAGHLHTLCFPQWLSQLISCEKQGRAGAGNKYIPYRFKAFKANKHKTKQKNRDVPYPRYLLKIRVKNQGEKMHVGRQIL